MQPADRPQQPRPFWRDMGPASHACQVYRDDEELLDTLAGFIGGGLWSGEAAVVIATHTHLEALEQLLRLPGLDLSHCRAHGRYVELDAESTLTRFLVDDMPDARRFEMVIGDIVARAGRGGRPVRAYGEMVAVLWSRGRFAAALRLEELWNHAIDEHAFRLLCGYPRAELHRADVLSIQRVHELHSLVHAA